MLLLKSLTDGRGSEVLMKGNDGSMVAAYTTTQHLLVDLDDCSLFQATGLAHLLCIEYPDLGDCLVVQCGERSHHLVFDNHMPFDYLNNVIKLLWDFGIVNDEVKYFREMRGDFSLRISEKLTVDIDKKIPEAIYYLSNNQTPQRDEMIIRYLQALSFFNPTVYELLVKPLCLFPVRHLFGFGLQLHDLRFATGV